MIRVDTLASMDALGPMIPAWNRLADRVGASLFVRPSWGTTWWEHLGRGTLRVVVATEGDELVGLLPLHGRSLGPLRVLRFLGHGLGAVGEALVDPGRADVSAALWDEALGGVGRIAQLVEYRRDGAGLAELRALVPGCRVHAHDTCPVIEPGPDVDAFLAGRKKSHRRRLRQAAERLEAAGEAFTLETVTLPDRVAAVLPEVERVYRAAERENPRLDLFAEPWAPFTRDLLSRTADEGSLRLFVGRVGGVVVTADLGFAVGGWIVLWAGRFEPSAREYSPGHLALAQIVRRASDESRGVDLSIGDDPYKLAWSTGTYETTLVLAGSGRITSAVARGVDLGGERYHRLRERATASTLPAVVG